MNTEQERAEFEAWYAEHYAGGDWSLGRDPMDPDEYVDLRLVDGWEAWRARAALQSQGREDADAWEWADANLVRAEAISDAQWEVENLISETFRGYTLREAIDHARRVEEDAE